MVSRLVRIAVLLVGVMGLTAVARPVMAAPIKVVASFSILADMVREIGGDRVQVTTLVGANGDSHLYQPTPSDARALMTADLVVINGLGFESWFDRLRASTASKAPVVVATAGLAPKLLSAQFSPPRFSPTKSSPPTAAPDGAVDPHAWQTLANAPVYIGTITRGLCAAAPADAAFFEANAALYQQRLAALNQWVIAQFDAIPREQRRIITSHRAFGYFADAYGLDLIAPVGLSTEAEPSARAIAMLIRQMKATQVRAVFLENMMDPRLVERIAHDGGGVVGGTLYADALSGPDGPAASYEAMFRHNVATLTAALTAEP